MSDQIDTIITQEPAGSPLSPSATLDQWMTEADLNWKVVPRPVLVQGNHENRLIPNFKALVRSDTGATLDVVSDSFRVHQNRDLLNVFQSFCSAGDLTLDTMGCLMGGRKIFANARVNGDITINTPKGPDTHRMYFLLSTGHFAGFCTQADLTDIRTVCRNTLSMARTADATEETRWRLTHLGSWTAARELEVKNLLNRALGRATTLKQEWETLYSSPCDRVTEALFYAEQFQPELYSRVVAAAHTRTLKVGRYNVGLPISSETGGSIPFGQARLTTLDAIINDMDARRDIVQTILHPNNFSRTVTKLLETSGRQPGANLSVNTMSHPVNAVTFWTDHERGNGGDGALDSAMFGQGRRDKSESMSLALSYASALQTIAGVRQ